METKNDSTFDCCNAAGFQFCGKRFAVFSLLASLSSWMNGPQSVVILLVQSTVGDSARRPAQCVIHRQSISNTQNPHTSINQKAIFYIAFFSIRAVKKFSFGVYSVIRSQQSFVWCRLEINKSFISLTNWSWIILHNNFHFLPMNILLRYHLKLLIDNDFFDNNKTVITQSNQQLALIHPWSKIDIV